MSARQFRSERYGLARNCFRLLEAAFVAPAPNSIISVKIGQRPRFHRVGAREIRVEGDRRVKESDNRAEPAFAVVGRTLGLGLQEQLLRRHVARAADADYCSHGIAQGSGERCGHALRNIHLDLDRVAGRAVIILRPLVEAGAAVDQFCADPDRRRGRAFPDASGGPFALPQKAFRFARLTL